jgi:hypothetical protein
VEWQNNYNNNKKPFQKTDINCQRKWIYIVELKCSKLHYKNHFNLPRVVWHVYSVVHVSNSLTRSFWHTWDACQMCMLLTAQFDTCIEIHVSNLTTTLHSSCKINNRKHACTHIIKNSNVRYLNSDFSLVKEIIEGRLIVSRQVSHAFFFKWTDRTMSTGQLWALFFKTRNVHWMPFYN